MSERVKPSSKMTDKMSAVFRTNLNANPHGYEDISGYHVISPVKATKLKLDPPFQTRGDFTRNSPPLQIDEGKEVMLAGYLERMVASRRGEIGPICPEPKWALIPVRHAEKVNFADDEETKKLGDTLEDFFNSTTRAASPNSKNEPEWKTKVRTVKQAQDSRMDAWRAGKQCNGVSEQPIEEKYLEEARLSTPAPATSSLDDLRTLIDITAGEASKQYFDDASKPTITIALNYKYALEAVDNSPQAAAKTEKAVADAPTSLSVKQKFSSAPSPDVKAEELAQAVPSVSVYGLLFMNATDDNIAAEIGHLLGQYREKITKYESWGKKRAVFFQSVEERDLALANIPDYLKPSSESKTKGRQHGMLVMPIGKRKVSNRECSRSIAFVTASEPTFTIFPKLPARLRMKIWNHARPESRIIKLCASASAKCIYSTAPVPALLHVCRESRSLAQTWYELSFATNEARKPKVYFDFTRDGIYTRCRGCLGSNCLHKKTWTRDHHRVKLIAFEAPMSRMPFRKIARFYPGVEELILIKGRSTVPRGLVPWEAFEKVDKRFSWQDKEDDIVVLYSGLMKDKEPLLARESRLRKVTRMALPGVVETPEPTSSFGEGMWPVCI